jgi:hypothetical protein
MNTEHTSGPWNVVTEPFWRRTGVIVGNSGKTAVAQARFAGSAENFSEAPDPQIIPNARLISAAPDMLSALRKAKDWMEVEGDYGKDKWEEHDQNVYDLTMEAINAAITKATQP